MRVEAFGAGMELHRAGERAAAFARAGFDGLWLAEAGRTAYLACGASALAAPELRIGTAVATAFPRSPMVTARLVEKYGDVAECLILYFATEAWEQGPVLMERWRDAIARVKAIRSAPR